jgi:hypothetical protein
MVVSAGAEGHETSTDALRFRVSFRPVQTFQLPATVKAP